MRLRHYLPLILLAACSGDPAGLGPGSVRLDVDPRPSPAAPSGWAADVQVENPTSRTVYIADHCGQQVLPRLERRENGGWAVASYGIACAAIVTPPIEVAPGGRYEGSIPLPASGRYRMTVRIGTSAENLWEEQSPEFVVPLED
ncbi:MAG TPA: hypothetical protein VE871_12405 [Longimicrobium sp.]|nr:hypothetical protein [Longimicrobium sp.]